MATDQQLIMRICGFFYFYLPKIQNLCMSYLYL